MKYRINHKRLLFICGILGALAVGLGAFGAHGLKNLLPVDKLGTYNTGISYYFYHTITLLVLAILIKNSPSKWFNIAAWCFIIGIIFFSGSLFLLATRDVIGLSNYRWLGPITPIGGVFFILGWVSISIGAIKYNDKKAAN